LRREKRNAQASDASQMNKLMAARFVVPAFATAVLTTHAIALDLKYRCPVEGQFEAPPLIFGGIPNPSGGWQLWLEGTPQKMELTPLRGHGDGWRFACYIDVGGAAVELTASIGGERKCQLIPNKRRRSNLYAWQSE
jgi:hypothetical protein